jgi:hypothetical protein
VLHGHALAPSLDETIKYGALLAGVTSPTETPFGAYKGLSRAHMNDSTRIGPECRGDKAVLG